MVCYYLFSVIWSIWFAFRIFVCDGLWSEWHKFQYSNVSVLTKRRFLLCRTKMSLKEPSCTARNYDKRAVSKDCCFIPYHIAHWTLSSVCLMYTTFLEDHISAFRPFIIIFPTNLRKATISLSVPPSVFRLPLDRFSLYLIFQYFSKNCRENSSFIKIGEK